MKPARDASLRERLFTGMSPGLPPKTKCVPFGNQCRYRDILGLTEAQLQVVVALVAAEFSQMTPVTLREIEARVSCCPKAMMHALVSSGWVAEVGQVKGRTAKLYAPAPRAWRDLGLQGWSLLKEVA